MMTNDSQLLGRSESEEPTKLQIVGSQSRPLPIGRCLLCRSTCAAEKSLHWSNKISSSIQVSTRQLWASMLFRANNKNRFGWAGWPLMTIIRRAQIDQTAEARTVQSAGQRRRITNGTTTANGAPCVCWVTTQGET